MYTWLPAVQNSHWSEIVERLGFYRSCSRDADDGSAAEHTVDRADGVMADLTVYHWRMWMTEMDCGELEVESQLDKGFEIG